MASTRRLAAILAADVAGYSRLMGADEERTHERLKAHFREVVDPKIAEHRGRIVKNTGDGLLAEFPSVVDAVRCAVEVQRGMIDREPEFREERRIRFRIGINLGDVIAEEHDIFGDGVNVAARLEALAEPGGVCISRVVRDQVRDKLPYQFEDMGEQSVKNIARPVRAYALRPGRVASLAAPGLPARLSRRGRAVIGTLATAALVIACTVWWFWPGATLFSRTGKPADQATTSSTAMPTAPAAASAAQPPVAPRLSIVVLPFTNLSNDPEQQYFVDGITEDLTTDLSRIADSFVISRNTAFTYKDKPVNAKQVGHELGVRYVLEGSVQRSGQQVRVNAQLIDAESDTHVWAERFDGDTSDLFALQGEITSRIATALNLALVRAEAARPTERPDALDYILRGRAAYWNAPRGLHRYSDAIDLFEHALLLDSHSVEAQSYLASALSVRGGSSYAVDIERAEKLVEQALATSPLDPMAHYARAQLLRAQNRWSEAILEYEVAIASNRNWASAYGNIGDCKLWIGSLEETIPLEERAIRLSPRDPLIGYWYEDIGNVHLLQSRTDEAIAWFEKARNADPEYFPRHARLAAAYALKGENERAAAELAEARRLVSDDRFSSISRLSRRNFGVPKVRALVEATYFAGLRKAGMPEE